MQMPIMANRVFMGVLIAPTRARVKHPESTGRET